MKAKNPKLWVETVSVDALRPYGNNAKIHTPEQIELDETYCSAALSRWEEETGQKGELVK